jgi:hypothetical protein
MGGSSLSLQAATGLAGDIQRFKNCLMIFFHISSPLEYCLLCIKLMRSACADHLRPCTVALGLAGLPECVRRLSSSLGHHAEPNISTGKHYFYSLSPELLLANSCLYELFVLGTSLASVYQSIYYCIFTH